MKKATLLLCLCYASSYSQNMFYIENGPVTINSATTLAVIGNVQTANAATIGNSGTINLSGNWINNSGNNCFGISQGTVTFSGAAQSIGGTTSTTFNNLSLQGTGNKTLLINTTTGGGNVTPTGILSLSGLALILNSKTLTITNPSSACIVRTTGFIESETTPVTGYGTIQWNIGTSAPAGSYDFPFGSTATGNNFSLSYLVTTAGTGNGSIRAATYPTNTAGNPNNRPLPTGVSVLLNTSGTENAPKTIDRWWMIDALSYTTNPVATLGFTYQDNEWSSGNNSISENLLQAQHLNGSVWTFPPVGTVNTTSNRVTVSGVNNFNTIWTLTGSDSPLPIELLDFTAFIKNETVTCNWITTTEINNDYFTIERSSDAMLFEAVGQVNGAGNSTEVLNYSFVDEHPFPGVSYYRLKQTDFDGRFTYSQTVAVKAGKSKLVIYPNPATDKLFISITGNINESFSVGLYDASGRLVINKSILTSADPGINSLNIADLPMGVYMLQLIADGAIEQHKVIIK